MDFVEAIEKELGVNAVKEFLPLQPGDVPATYANVDDLVHDLDYKPETTIEYGVHKFIQWYKEYYHS
jgi:UDP-glucuronate 4-epimerase